MRQQKNIKRNSNNSKTDIFLSIASLFYFFYDSLEKLYKIYFYDLKNIKNVLTIFSKTDMSLIWKVLKMGVKEGLKLKKNINQKRNLILKKKLNKLGVNGGFK